jgi:uncharacterized membrane protein
MGNNSRNKNNLQNAHSQSIQSVSYKGLLPPPDMMEQFKKLDPNLPERIVRMAERSFDMAEKELDIIAESERKGLSIMEHEAETKRMALKEDAKYDFRAQTIILAMVLLLLSATVALGLRGQATLAGFVAAGGFAAIIIAAIKGVSNKTKQ